MKIQYNQIKQKPIYFQKKQKQKQTGEYLWNPGLDK